jgi:hypothetical protein
LSRQVNGRLKKLFGADCNVHTTPLDVANAPDAEVIHTVGELEKTEPSFGIRRDGDPCFQEFNYSLRYGEQRLSITNSTFEVTRSHSN